MNDKSFRCNTYKKPRGACLWLASAKREKFQTNARKSFCYYLFADPHPINPVVSILYRIMGGRGADLRSSLYPQVSNYSPHAGSGPPTVVPGGIGVCCADGTFGAITG
jgi:hypothetical protein